MKPAPMPQTVKIGCHLYGVNRFPSRDSGECDFDGLQINVKPRLRRGKAKEILLHEILHACTYPAQTSKRLTDEEFVDATAPVLLGVIQDNPELLEYLRT
jgi:hypothetical protein